jgi:hypothetical protein
MKKPSKRRGSASRNASPKMLQDTRLGLTFTPGPPDRHSLPRDEKVC